MRTFWCPTHADDADPPPAHVADPGPAHVADPGPARQAEPRTNLARLQACAGHEPAWRDNAPEPGETCECARCGGLYSYGFKAEVAALREYETDAGSRLPEDEQAAQAAGYLER